MSTHRKNGSVKVFAKSQRKGYCHLNPSRTGLRGRVCNPQGCVHQASLGRYPWDMGAAWGSGYPKGSSSQEDSPLAKSAWLLAPGSQRDRTCGHSQWVIKNEGAAAPTSPSFLENDTPPDEGSSSDMEDLGRSKPLQGHLR